MDYFEKPKGISIVVVSFERLGALKVLLDALIKQDYRGIPVELILVNNSPRYNLSKSLFSAVGRRIGKISDCKIVNSQFNWGPGIRYAMATTAAYQTLLFIDDDIFPTDYTFIADMYSEFMKLDEHDILTCWADLWVDWGEDFLTTASINFLSPEIKRLTECDYAGTGINMIRKRTLIHPDLLDIRPEFKFADTAWYPWLPTIIYGSHKYYYPSYNRLAFHKEKKIGSLCAREGYEQFIFSARKEMLALGYLPARSRMPNNTWVSGSPEEEAANTIPLVKRPW